MICQYLPYKQRELAFALFRSEVLVLILGALMSAILKWSASCTVFANFLENKSRSRQKSYTTFINSSWGICEQNMRVVIFGPCATSHSVTKKKRSQYVKKLR